MDWIRTSVLGFIAVQIYTVAAFGFAYVVGHSKISLSGRTWLARKDSEVAYVLLMLLECPACFGFWIGLSIGGILTGIADAPWIVSIATALVLGFYTCGSNFTIGRMTRLIQ